MVDCRVCTQGRFPTPSLDTCRRSLTCSASMPIITAVSSPAPRKSVPRPQTTVACPAAAGDQRLPSRIPFLPTKARRRIRDMDPLVVRARPTIHSRSSAIAVVVSPISFLAAAMFSQQLFPVVVGAEHLPQRLLATFSDDPVGEPTHGHLVRDTDHGGAFTGRDERPLPGAPSSSARSRYRKRHRASAEPSSSFAASR